MEENNSKIAVNA